MKTITNWILGSVFAFSLILSPNVSFSAPVRYEFQVEVNNDQPFYPQGSVVSGSFIYNNESKTTGTLGLLWGDGFGDHLRYGEGVVNNFHGQIEGNGFLAGISEILIADATPTDSYAKDGYFIGGGSKSHGGFPVNGFTKNGYTLVGFTFFGWGNEDLYSSINRCISIGINHQRSG